MNGLSNEFANGAIRGMGQAAGSAWYSSSWLLIAILIIVVYYLHNNPPEAIMSTLSSDSTGYQAFVGKWYARPQREGDQLRIVKFSADAKTFSMNGTKYAIEEGFIYAIAGAPKLRFDVELKDGVLSHVFAVATKKYITLSVGGGKPLVYWNDERRARGEEHADSAASSI